ncbi:MAG: PEP/pyruvate-binding domain-containing protein [Myxococcota bacterium]
MTRRASAEPAGEFTRRLEDLDRTQAATAGGKGASLGELIRAGAKVPPAFVLLRVAFEAFMAKADPGDRVGLWLDAVDRGERSLAGTASAIAELLGDATLPANVASEAIRAFDELGSARVSVRSSATCEDGAGAAWAGQLDTYLNVGRDDLLAKIRECWLSAFREPALAYGVAHGYGAGEFGVAVVVQQMVASEVSGIGFSVHPVTQEPHLALLEACFGQGEAIVSGAVTPDQYVVERTSKRIVLHQHADQDRGLFLGAEATEPVWRDLGALGADPKLGDEAVREYVALLERLESHYGCPVDTEWARVGDEFQLLQARPITTLAREYRETIVDETEPWTLMVRRPFNLFEVSLAGHWMDPDHMGRDFGVSINRFLAIQDEGGMFNLYATTRQLDAAVEGVKRLERDDRARLISFLERANGIYEQGRRRVESGIGFEDLDEACEYLMDVGRNTTGLPVWTLFCMEALRADDPVVTALAEGLRAKSLYTAVAHRMVDPAVERAARKLGFSQPARAAELTTWREMTRGPLDVAVLEQRLQCLDAGDRAVFQFSEDDEQVRFVSETGYLMMRLAGERRLVPPDDPDRVSGQAAWPGVHRGRARVILSSDPTGYTIDDGDVLVSIQSNPGLMPLLQRAGAIVTDDGGVACHAGIICRELKVPTLIGTGRATSTIHDGDLVEVDATRQLVRILERAG